MPLTSTLVLVFKLMESKCLFTNNRGKKIIGDGSCKPFGACVNGNNYKIGNDSCNWLEACNRIGRDCGFMVCKKIDKDNRGYAVIGDNSCNGFTACNDSGVYTTAKIGNGSCNDHAACQENKGTIGDNSCHGGLSCSKNEGTIDSGCCNYGHACRFNKGHIKKGSDECCGTPKRWTWCGYGHWCGWDEKEVPGSKTSDGCHLGAYKIQCQKQTASC